jgi:hypothetical protein
MKQCLTCKHWNGDREEAQERAKSQPGSMDLYSGWMSAGDCGVSHIWGDLVVVGDAYATLEIDASFGCIYHEDLEK